MYRLEAFSPLSNKWMQIGPSASDLAPLRRELAEASAICSVIGLRIVDSAGSVVVRSGELGFQSGSVCNTRTLCTVVQSEA